MPAYVTDAGMRHDEGVCEKQEIAATKAGENLGSSTRAVIWRLADLCKPSSSSRPVRGNSNSFFGYSWTFTL